MILLSDTASRLRLIECQAYERRVRRHRRRVLPPPIAQSSRVFNTVILAMVARAIAGK